jgi:hypothetical protein
MDDKNEEFYRRVDEVLHYLWDPIGICAEPGARDEYKTYALQVFNMFKQNKEAKEISNYLEEIIKNKIGLIPNIENCGYVTEVLVNYKNYIFNG